MSVSSDQSGIPAAVSLTRAVAAGLMSISLVLLFSCSGDDRPGGEQAGGMGGMDTGISGSGGGGWGGTAGVGGVAGTAGTSGVGGVAGIAGTGGVAGTAGTGGVAGEAGTGGTGGTAGTAGTGGTAGTAGTSGTGGTGGTTGGGDCLQGITGYQSTGPFTFTETSKTGPDTGGSILFWVPDVPAGCKVPVVHLANGTFGFCQWYGESLRLLASHGFLAVCYESMQTGAGTQGMEALELAFAEYPDLIDLRIGSTGHSQGGQSSFCVLQFAEEKWGPQGAILAGLAMEPASGFGAQPPTGTWQQVYAKIRSPMFMFSGQGSDGMVQQSWVQDGFNALDGSIEAYHWSKAGAQHLTPNPEEMEVAVSWFRWKLLGDQDACRFFKEIKNDPTWIEAAVQNEQACQ